VRVAGTFGNFVCTRDMYFLVCRGARSAC